MIHTMRTLLFVVVAAYVVALILIRCFESYFVFAPGKRIHMTPEDVGLAYEEVSFRTTDGFQLSAWYVPSAAPRGVVLFCHGNAGNNSHRLESLSLFHDLQLDTFIFDYRGYGKSGGRPSEQGTYRDAEAAWDYLVQKRGVPPELIVVFGRSLGGAVAAYLATSRSPAAVIIESAFTSIRDIGRELYPFLPIGILSTIRYDTLSSVHAVSSPLLVIHSKDDEMIHLHHGKRLFEAASEPKRFLVLAGTHNEGFLQSGSRYRDGLDAFVREFVDTT
jgi:fermentation-respiration switch protein FrsA (DUF1100 family)